MGRSLNSISVLSVLIQVCLLTFLDSLLVGKQTNLLNSAVMHL